MWGSFHNQLEWFILVSCPHLFITALLLFPLLRLLAVVKEPGLGISCILGQRGAGGTCISFSLTSLFFSIGASWSSTVSCCRGETRARRSVRQKQQRAKISQEDREGECLCSAFHVLLLGQLQRTRFSLFQGKTFSQQEDHFIHFHIKEYSFQYHVFNGQNVLYKDSQLRTWTTGFTGSCSPTSSQLRPTCHSFAFLHLPIALLIHLSIDALLLSFLTFPFISRGLWVRAGCLLSSRTKNKIQRWNKEESTTQDFNCCYFTQQSHRYGPN